MSAAELDYPQTNPDAGAGYPGHLTPEQQQKLDSFRQQLQDAGHTERLDTPSLCRFLRARKYDVQKAFTMFTDCEQWRKDFGVDEINRTFVFTENPLVTVYYPRYYHKTDKDGRPVYIEQLGKVDINKMYQITSQERLLQNLVNEYEKFADPRLPACSRKAGKLIETSCTILDLKGVGLRTASQVYGYLQEASKIGQNYYPERMGKFYLLNAPWGFSTVWNVIKRWLDPVTVEKISILGSSYQNELLAQIPADNLPVQFGGKCRCQGGCELSDEGPWQDPQYLSPKQREKMEKIKAAKEGKSEAPPAAVPEPKKEGEEEEGEERAGAPAPAAA